jgi:hypothetical protein
MQPGIPGDVYCPELACMAEDMLQAIAATKEARERREQEEYRRLKAKYEGIAE